MPHQSTSAAIQKGGGSGKRRLSGKALGLPLLLDGLPYH